MAEVKVFFKPEVEHFLNELIYILYKENYFSYLENAIDYKDKIIDFIEENISNFPYKNTPEATESPHPAHQGAQWEWNPKAGTSL